MITTRVRTAGSSPQPTLHLQSPPTYCIEYSNPSTSSTTTTTTTTIIMHYKDPLEPLRTPAPRNEYYSDDDEDDVAEHRPPQPSPTSADLSIHWDSPPASASASSSLPIHLLIFIGALTRPLQHGLLPQRSSRKGKMVMSRSNVETEVLDVEEVDGKEERLMVASTVGHLSADWLYPIAIKLLETCRSPSQTLE